MSPRTGRPTDNPRPNKISIRISNEDKRIIEDYCEQEYVNKTEAISRGIKRLEKDIKKNDQSLQRVVVILRGHQKSPSDKSIISEIETSFNSKMKGVLSYG